MTTTKWTFTTIVCGSSSWPSYKKSFFLFCYIWQTRPGTLCPGGRTAGTQPGSLPPSQNKPKCESLDEIVFLLSFSI